MPNYEFRTWKSSTLYGVDDFWCNRWFVSVPYEVDVNTDGGPGLAAAICEFEAQIHQSHVHYSHVTMVEASLPDTPGAPDVTTFRNYIYTRYGFQGTPTNPAPFYTVRKVAKYVDSGRTGQWWFRGCVDLDQIEIRPDKGIVDHQRNYFDAIVAVWVGAMQYYHSATILVPQGVNRTGSIVSFSNVNRTMSMGVATANAQRRKDPLKHGTGQTIIVEMTQQAELLTDWSWQVYAYPVYLYNSYYTGQWIDYTVTLLQNWRSVCNTIKSYCDSVAGSLGGGAGAGFRWVPGASQCSDLAQSEVTTVESDIDAINMIPYTRNGDGTQTVDNDAMHQLNDILVKHRSVMAVLARADWLNPAAAGS